MSGTEPNRGLHHRPGADVEATRRELEALGWQIFVLPERITDRRAFFDGVRSTIPLDPPVLSDENWDALSDSIWSGLDGLDSEKVAVIWPASTAMAALAQEDYENAQEILADIADSLADIDATAGEPKQLMVILA